MDTETLSFSWGCGDCTPTNPAFVPSDAVAVLVDIKKCGCRDWERGGDCGSWCDSDGIAVVRLKDGRIGVSQEWSDSSGHG